MLKRLYPAFWSLLMSTTSLLPAATFQLTTIFDDAFDDSLTGSIVGTGTLTYTAETALTDGAYAWHSLSDPLFTAQFADPDEMVFAADGSSAAMDAAFVEVRGSSFFFSYSGFEAAALGGGLIALENGEGMALLFEPVPVSTSENGYTGLTPEYVILDDATGDMVMGGNYGVASAIPEPSTYAALAGALALGVVVWRRRASGAAKA